MKKRVYEQLSLFQADSSANPLVWPESSKENPMIVTYGPKCSELSEPLARVGSSVRMYLESCALPLPTLYRTWSVRAITSSCLLLKLRLSVRHIDGNELHLLPTVRAKEDCDYQYAPKSKKKIITLQGAVKMLPTPRASKHTSENLESWMQRYEKKGVSTMPLALAVKMWPTPAARDYKGCNSAEHIVNARQRGARGHMGQLPNAVMMYPTPIARNGRGPSETETREGAPDLQTVVGGQLNPTWVEWLMGFPTGWTDLNA